GGVGWLDPFQAVDSGYDRFFADIGTVVFGRLTFEQAIRFDGPWPFAGRRGFVVASRAVRDLPDGTVVWKDDVTALVRSLQSNPGTDGDAWIVGGAMLQAAFIAEDAMDSIDLFVIPTLLGDGVRAFPPSVVRKSLVLRSSETLGMGMVRLSYDFASTD
ncbi:MAG: dihydrofolate reductase family protein, partial [Alphaproteobacteria bacterium]